MKFDTDIAYCTKCNWSGTFGESYSDLNCADICPECGRMSSIKEGKRPASRFRKWFTEAWWITPVCVLGMGLIFLSVEWQSTQSMSMMILLFLLVATPLWRLFSLQ